MLGVVVPQKVNAAGDRVWDNLRRLIERTTGLKLIGADTCYFYLILTVISICNINT